MKKLKCLIMLMVFAATSTATVYATTKPVNTSACGAIAADSKKLDGKAKGNEEETECD